MPTLLLSWRFTEDSQALWRAAIELGWQVERVRGVRLPPGLEGARCILYVEGLLAPEIAAQLGLTLVEPPADWLQHVPVQYRKRSVRLTTLGEARQLTEPNFIKPPNDKAFQAKVYQAGAELPTEFDDEMSVLVAEPVSFEVEYRCFVLDRTIRTMSPYVRHGELARNCNFASPDAEADEARTFAETVLADPVATYPRAFVMDVGKISDRGWAVVELNAAWGSGIYGCDPKSVLSVLQHAVVSSPA
jgi:hypothetical protein